ncbi:MAG: TatD family hydrolase, partial [Chlorobiales bacterium]|nr:TatD family hydrolase [Chlorobiales bacterium]
SPAHHLVDVHAHLCDAVFDRDLETVLSRARAAGVGSVIAVGEDLADARKNISLAAANPMIRPAAGLYPTCLDLDKAQEMAEFILGHHDQLVAIGEVGLDFWAVQDPEGKAVQREIFGKFIALSKDLSLPLNIHSRSAGRHAVKMLLEHGATLVHLHAFDGKYGTAMPAVEAGYYFSVPPSVVRSRQKQKLVKQLPLSCLLVESDSPVLGPTPAERNEPANIPVVVEAISSIKGVDARKVIEAVAENTARLYPIGDR